MIPTRSLRAVAALSCFACLLVAASSAQAGAQSENDYGRTALPMKVSGSIHFREVGPAVTGGRVTAVVGVPGNPQIYYVGAADGGIFRTEDGGITWKALFQHERVASIGALAIDPRNPSVIWAGTGEANVRNDVSFGDGIYKSTDAGLHWRRMGLDHTFQISRIAVDPLDPGTVLVAAMGSPWTDDPDRGVYRTTDGGKNWQKVLFVGPSVGISDMAMDPKNPEIVYAAAYRFRRTAWGYSDGGPQDAIYKSIDGGVTWKRLSGHGLPTQPVSRIGLAIAASSPNVVYAVIGSKEGVLWRSEDYGEHWSLVGKNHEADARPFYFSGIAVDPKNADRVLALSMDLLESTDGGLSFHQIAKKIHVDYHAIWFDPDGSGRIIDGNDGGVALSRDDGGHWAYIGNLPIAQYYHVALGRGMRYEICGGLQDNGSWCGPSRSKDPSGILDRMWFTMNAGDGIYAIPATDNRDLIYNSTQEGTFMVFDQAAEQPHDIEPNPRDFMGAGVAKLPYRFAWEAGFAVSPDSPKVLYAGGNVLFESEDRGRTWQVMSPDLTRNDKSKQGSSGGPVVKDNSGAEVYDAILTISVAQSDPRVIWVGTDDGEVQLTRDGGKSWTNLTAHIHGLAPWGRVESIDVSATDPGDVLIAVDRHFSGDFKPYLLRSSDYGARWTSVSGNLPKDVYAHVIRRDMRDPDLYYAGLENGLYVSWDAGRRWYLFGLGLPDAAVYDIALDARDNDLVIATHGRSSWVLDDLTPFQDLDAQVAHAPLTLFHPEDALRFWPWSDAENLGDGVFYGENPPYGAAISYYLPMTASKPAELVITNASGQVVRTLKGLHEGKPEVMTPAEPTQGAPAKAESAAVATPASETGKVPWVPAQAGLHRIYWDLRADGFTGGPKVGPLLPPGKYTATLKIGGQTASQTFTVVNDPTSHAPLTAMKQRYELTEAVLHELSRLDVAVTRLHAIHVQAESLRIAASGTSDQAAVDAAIDSLEGAAKAVKLTITSGTTREDSSILGVPDRIHEHLQALDSLLEAADDAPTAATLRVKATYDAEYRAALAAYDHFLASDVVQFNQKMVNRHLTGVVPGRTLAP